MEISNLSNFEQTIVVNGGENNDHLTGVYGTDALHGGNGTPCIDLIKYKSAAVHYDFSSDGANYIAQLSGENSSKIEHDTRIIFPSENGKLFYSFAINEVSVLNDTGSSETLMKVIKTATYQRSVQLYTWDSNPSNNPTYSETISAGETKVIDGSSVINTVWDYSNTTEYEREMSWTGIPSNNFIGFDVDISNTNLKIVGFKGVLRVRGVYL